MFVIDMSGESLGRIETGSENEMLLKFKRLFKATVKHKP